MDKVTFDTNAFENRDVLRFQNSNLYVSAIVLMELMTACSDSKELKIYQKAYKDAERFGFLITPNEQDIFDAARIQFLLAQDRQDVKGNAPKRVAKIKQELAMDCLIAVSASREKASVVTNDNDYWEIQRYLRKLKLVKL